MLLGCPDGGKTMKSPTVDHPRGFGCQELLNQMHCGCVQTHRFDHLVLRLSTLFQTAVSVGGQQDFGVLPTQRILNGLFVDLDFR
jgi:hypothetical protein